LPFNGIFAGWPEGVTRKARLTYRSVPLTFGGNGNDFTLTVTNLPLAFASYRLAEGNGNQTVEPDECNLLYLVFAQSAHEPAGDHQRDPSRRHARRGRYRASSTYAPIPAGSARENLIPFQFRTDRSLGCGQPVTFELVLGVQGEGPCLLSPLK
jgi:hypothetical protein